MTVKQFVKQNDETGRFILKSVTVNIERTLATSISINDVEFILENPWLTAVSVMNSFFKEYEIETRLKTKNEERRYSIQLRIDVKNWFVEIRKF